MSPATEQHFTLAEISERLHFDQKTLRRWFEMEPGVVRMVSQSVNPRKAPRVYLRIPQSVLERVYNEKTRPLVGRGKVQPLGRRVKE